MQPFQGAIQTYCEISFEMDLGASSLLLSKEDRLGWVHLTSCATRAEQNWQWQQSGWGGFQAVAVAPCSLPFSERRKCKRCQASRVT